MRRWQLKYINYNYDIFQTKKISSNVSKIVAEIYIVKIELNFKKLFKTKYLEKR